MVARMPRKRKASSHSPFYTRIGNRGWRKSGYDTFAFRSSAFRKWMGSQLAAGEAAILSVGCGAGELEGELSAAGLTVVGLDLSHAMLRRGLQNGLGMAVQADAAALPFEARTFDAVMFVESIGYLRLDDVFKEARRVLKPDGRLMITSYPAQIDAHARYRKWRIEQVMEAMIAAGFTIASRQYLNIVKNRVNEAPSERRCKLFYLSSSEPR
ncbi:MAG TPA: class I SAM-dependent methyltransferase [Stellaceae bacterium]|nr:class I SAM-dependent methyltransferase [Stellaceae bacterium]